MTGLRRRLHTAIVGALAALALGAVASAPAAAATTGNAYVVVGNWNCVGGGKVVAVYGAVDNVWSGGDAGDNIVYPKVRIGVTNTFNGRAYCQRSWLRGGDYWINVVWKQFRPTANKQTFWF